MLALLRKHVLFASELLFCFPCSASSQGVVGLVRVLTSISLTILDIITRFINFTLFNPLHTANCYDNVHIFIRSSHFHQYRENISSRISVNSVAFASEFIEMFPRHYINSNV